MIEFNGRTKKRLMGRYDTLSSNVDDFIESEDRNSIRFAASSAIEACQRAADHGLRILGVEGGEWLNPGFRSRLDSLWSGLEGQRSEEEIRKNNMEAAEFIREEAARADDRPTPDVFILTVRPFSGD